MYKIKPLLKAALTLMKNLLKALAISILIPLGLTLGASETEAAIQKKIFGSCEELNGTTKTIKSLEESGFLIKGVNKTIRKKGTRKQISWQIVKFIY